jgi:hypothetical protein
LINQGICQKICGNANGVGYENNAGKGSFPGERAFGIIPQIGIQFHRKLPQPEEPKHPEELEKATLTSFHKKKVIKALS